MAQFAEVVTQALELPADQRAALAHRLIVSLGKQSSESAETIEERIAHRQRRLEAGAMTYDSVETLARARAALEQSKRP